MTCDRQTPLTDKLDAKKSKASSEMIARTGKKSSEHYGLPTAGDNRNENRGSQKIRVKPPDMLLWMLPGCVGAV